MEHRRIQGAVTGQAASLQDQFSGSVTVADKTVASKTVYMTCMSTKLEAHVTSQHRTCRSTKHVVNNQC